MATRPDDLGYATDTSTFSFREIGSIKIPKSVRERAFQMEVSVEIVGVPRVGYVNYKSYPANGFFGYATIVFYNYVTALIPIQFGRNTIYFERQEAAYSAWETFKRYHSTRYDFFELTDVVGQLASYLGATVTPAPYDPPIWKGFEELPIREVYVKCPYGTTFRIEVTHKRALSFFDMDGTQILPKSEKPDDSKKDGGLPQNGIQPQPAPNPSNPYDGFEPASSSTDLGDWNNSSKLPSSANSGAGLDKPNPDNEPTPEGEGALRWMKVEARTRRPEYPNACSAVRVAKDYYLVNDTTQLIALTPNAGQGANGCGETVQLGGWKVQLTGGTPFDVGNSDSAPQISFQRGDTLPGSTLEYV
jgi:hypothetical protein